MMIRTKTGGMASFLLKPLCVVFLLAGLFGLIRLRSAVVAMTYEIRNLEEKKTEALKGTKLLLAERSKYASLDHLAASFRESAPERKVSETENYFGNRVRVIHIKKSTAPQPYAASLKTGEKKGAE